MLKRGMIFFKCLSQEFPVKMSIYLRGSNAFVAQHFLDSPEIGSPFY